MRFLWLVGLAVAVPAGAQTTTLPHLDTVAIVASRTRMGETARSIEVISRDQIAASTARTIADLLAERLGVNVDSRSPAQADISVRGGSPEQTLVLVDGVRVSDVQSAHYALDLALPLDAVERVEILRGAGSALYGPDAVGGVINIVTRTGRSAPEMSVRGGAFGTVGEAASGGTAVGPVTILSAAEYEKSDGYRAGTDYRNGEARITASSRAPGGSLLAHVGVGVRDFGANDFYGPYNSTERTGSTTADARWDVGLPGWSLTVDANTRRHTDRYTLIRDNPAIYENLHTSWQSGGELVARTVVGGLAVAVGTDGLNAQLTSARLGSRQEWRNALFGQATLGTTTSGTVDFGLRADRSSLYGGFLSPSIGASLPIGDDLRLRASAARGFRAPTWTERYYSDPSNQGNPDLTPETFWTGDIGMRVAMPGAASLDVAAYARRADDLIDWVKPVNSPPSALWRATNMGVATYRGIEATIALPRMNGVDYTLAGTALAFDDAEAAGFVGRYGLRPLTQQFIARAALPSIHAFRATVELMDARRAAESSYVTGNVRLEWRAAPVGITLDLTNLTNGGWKDASAQSVAGRAIYIGASWSGR